MRAPRPVIFEYDQIDSTIDEAKRLLKKHTPPFALFAHTQTSGRGRQGRSWHSPEGNLYFNAAFDVEGISAGDLPLFTLYAALKVADGLNRLLPAPELWVKWPNDIWYRRKKVAGFLAELTFARGKPKHLLLGIGVNLNTKKFPDEIKSRATSLGKIAHVEFDRARVAQLVAQICWNAFEQFRAGAKDLYQLWARYDKLEGRMIRFDWDGKNERGRVKGIAADGALCVRVGGKIQTLRSGEVSLSKYL